jgi:peptidoglycan/LPS O-acetylase OafA/YrhL
MGILLITIICAIHVYCVYNYYHPREIISVDTIICFLLGFYFSFSKKIIDKIFKKNDILYFGIIFALVLLYYKFYANMPRIIFYVSIKNGIYTIIIILISMKIRLKNDFLLLLNKHSYSIYLLQRVIMIYVSAKRIFNDNIFISFFFEFTGILFISSLFDKYTSFIDMMILRKKLGKNSEKLIITAK